MKQKLGDCIVISCQSVIDNPNFLFCHAYVMGQGKLAGQRILHAWNELGDVVFDFSNGNRVIIRKERYYELAQIKEEDVTKTNSEETRKLMFQTKSYGGWIK